MTKIVRVYNNNRLYRAVCANTLSELELSDDSDFKKTDDEIQQYVKETGDTVTLRVNEEMIYYLEKDKGE